MAIQSCAIAESNLVLTFYSSGYEVLRQIVSQGLISVDADKSGGVRPPHPQ